MNLKSKLITVVFGLTVGVSAVMASPASRCLEQCLTDFSICATTSGGDRSCMKIYKECADQCPAGGWL